MVEFDLTSARDPRFVQHRVVAVLVNLGGLVFGIAVCLYFVLSDALTNSWPDLSLLAVAVFALLPAAFAWGAWTHMPPATRLSVDTELVRLDFPWRRNAIYKWASPRLKIRLTYTEAGARDWLSGGQPTWSIDGGRSTFSLLTKDAFDEVIKVARSLGFSVTPHPMEADGWMEVTLYSSGRGEAARSP